MVPLPLRAMLSVERAEAGAAIPGELVMPEQQTQAVVVVVVAQEMALVMVALVK